MTETSGPRGRISLIKAVDEGRLDLLSPGFVHQMYECLDCRACEAVCPSGVPYGALVEDARARIETAREPHRPARDRLARRYLIRALFSHLPLMRFAAGIARVAQRSGLLRVARAAGFEKEAALLPPLPHYPFVPDGRRADVANAAGTAFLHTGCVMQVAFPDVHAASVRMINRAGLNVTVPRDQGCCGAIAVHAGDPATAHAMAKVNIESFERSGADVYVANAAGCGSALKEYAQWLAADPDWAERARRFAARVRDITEVLDACELPPEIGRLDATITYQEPCHLVHAQRVSAAPRRLLARIPGVTLVEMHESSVCCGSAGIYNLTQPGMARRLQERKVRNTLATGAQIVATANPGCAMQLSAGLRNAGSRTAVRHVVELLDAAYGNHKVAVTRS